mmetsp:Transcript_32370/g.54548  ORF Transcript_32370/g.54548 Transcript_32370/m.54548 type:complete len:86 (+) Transcript_32370:1208-1465(+)
MASSILVFIHLGLEKMLTRNDLDVSMYRSNTPDDLRAVLQALVPSHMQVLFAWRSALQFSSCWLWSSTLVYCIISYHLDTFHWMP